MDIVNRQGKSILSPSVYSRLGLGMLKERLQRLREWREWQQMLGRSGIDICWAATQHNLNGYYKYKVSKEESERYALANPKHWDCQLYLWYGVGLEILNRFNH